MDSLHFCIAVVPVATYLVLIGSLNLSSRPLITTGARDLAALTMAVSGFVVAGPMELFMPGAFASLLGGWVWVPMITLYILLVTLAVLLMRPRLVIYNISQERLRPLLAQVVGELDSGARWAGDGVTLPNLGVHLAIESYAGMRNVSLVAVGSEQDLDGWRKLRLRLQPLLASTKVPVNVQGFSFVFLAALLAMAVAYSLFTGRQEIASAVRQMLRQ